MWRVHRIRRRRGRPERDPGLDVVGPRGEVIVVVAPSYGKVGVDFDVYEMLFGGKAIRGSLSGSYNLSLAIPKLADLVVEGTLSIDPLVTDTRPMAEINEAMDVLEGCGQIRQLLLP